MLISLSVIFSKYRIFSFHPSHSDIVLICFLQHFAFFPSRQTLVGLPGSRHLPSRRPRRAILPAQRTSLVHRSVVGSRLDRSDTILQCRPATGADTELSYC